MESTELPPRLARIPGNKRMAKSGSKGPDTPAVNGIAARQAKVTPESPSREESKVLCDTDIVSKIPGKEGYPELLTYLRKSHEQTSGMLRLLEQLSKDQAITAQLLERRFELGLDRSALRGMAKTLWEQTDDAGFYLESTRVHNHGVNQDEPLGTEFLNNLAPCGKHLHATHGWTSNLQRAREKFENWVRGTERSSVPWQYDLFINSEVLSISELNWDPFRPDFDKLWPTRWDIAGLDVRFAYPKSWDNPHKHIRPWASTVNSLQETGRDEGICGVLCGISIDNASHTIDFGTVATILCLTRGSIFYSFRDPEFLDGHIGEWRERSVQDRRGLRYFQSAHHKSAVNSADPGGFWYGVYIHYMRSFMVSEPNDRSDPPRPGIKCKRESVNLKSPFDGRTLRLTERRYSTALSMLPLQRPSGHYVLVSVLDVGEGEDRDYLWDGAPTQDISAYDQLLSWKRYKLIPAGLFTGIPVFQLQICSFIDLWEKDWNTTIDKLDIMVSVKLKDLDEHVLRKKLMYDTKELQRSELYFEVLQILRIFSESIRSAPNYLATLAEGGLSDVWFDILSHKTEISEILDFNWKIVKSRQDAAAKKLLDRIAQKTEEVKSLRDGLFNAQSVREAIKGRQINKFLLVFTIVTIIFLPPTFVATFYGMHLFDETDESQTRYRFWIVFAAVSGFTYLAAVTGLSGVIVSPGQRKKWLKRWELKSFSLPVKDRYKAADEEKGDS